MTTLVDLAAIASVTTGASLIYAPAGFITAGSLVGLASWNAARPPKQRKDDG